MQPFGLNKVGAGATCSKAGYNYTQGGVVLPVPVPVPLSDLTALLFQHQYDESFLTNFNIQGESPLFARQGEELAERQGCSG